MTSSIRASKQSGAALIVVLLLVATLSFVLASFAETMTTATTRAYGERARTNAVWLAIGLESVAEQVLKTAKAAKALDVMTDDGPLFKNEISYAAGRGAARLRFRDATRCFNLNSLVSGENDSKRLDETRAEEFYLLANAVGVGEGESRGIVAVVADWIDRDVSSESQGAEDSFYTGLPVPYRTGSTPLASRTELRAMEGVSLEAYRALAPHLCALPDEEPIKINVNALAEVDAPLIVAALNGQIGVAEARALIANRPREGYTDVGQFCAAPQLAGVGESAGCSKEEGGGRRFAVKSDYLEAVGRLTVEDLELEQRMLFALSEAGEYKLAARSLGDWR